MNDATPRACPNCRTALSESLELAFCPACGQDNSRPRLEAKVVVLDVFQNFVGWDSALSNTIGGLFRHPGHLVAQYVGGRRRHYVNPARFCLLASAFWYLAMQLSGMDPMAASGINVTGTSSAEAADFAGQVRDFIRSHLELMQYLSLPLLAFALRVAFRKSGRNLAECLVFVLYLYGFRFLMLMVSVPVARFEPEVLAWSRAIFGLVWMMWGAKGFFGRGWWASLWRTFAAVVSHLVGTILLFGLISVPWVLWVAN